MSALPFTLLVLIAYNIAVFGFGDTALVTTIASIKLPSMAGTEAAWIISIADLLVLGGLVALFIEIAKATRTGNVSIADHGASFLVFVGFLLEFLLVIQAGNTTFFILMCIAGIDVLAGFTVSITGARRDWGGHHG